MTSFDEQSLTKILNEVSFKTSKSSGPGGQHVNTTESKVSLFWDFNNSKLINDKQKRLIKKNLKPYLTSSSELLKISYDKNRSQVQNKETCIKLFTQLLKSKAFYEKPKRKKTKPTKASIESRIQNKKHKSEKKSLRKKPHFD